MPSPSPDEAVHTIEEGHARMRELLDGIRDEAMIRPGTIGGGDWSAKDLIGHLAAWEEIALEALGEWRSGRKPWIEDVFDKAGVDEVNARNQERIAGMGLAEVRSSAEETLRRLVEEIRGMTDEEWRQKTFYETDRRKNLGKLLGSILGAPRYPFGHIQGGHLRELEAFAASAGPIT